MNTPPLNHRSNSTDAADIAAVRWGGLADIVRQDCLDADRPDKLDAKTVDLLQRLDELAACSGLNEVAQFINSPRGFSILERNYLMSPLLDQIYMCLTVPLSAMSFQAHQMRPALPVLRIPFELDIADKAGNHISVRPDRASLGVLVACMEGCADALEFMLGRERHLVSGMSCQQLLALLEGMSADEANVWYVRVLSHESMLVIQPLAIASYLGHVSCVECLLRHGADVHGDQDCALRCAAAAGYALMVDLLLLAGADVHAKSDGALRVAAYRGRYATVKRLLQVGADVTAGEQAAIREAAGHSSTSVLECLLDALGDTPLDGHSLMCALEKVRPDNLQLLLDRGADPNYEEGLPLDWAITCVIAGLDDHLSMIELLIKAGADVHHDDNEPLCKAIHMSSPEIVQLLLDHGASLEPILRDSRRVLPPTNRDTILEVLLNAGMPLDCAYAFEILMSAADADDTLTFEVFARRAASRVTLDSAKLGWATVRCDLQLIQALLKRDLDPRVLHGQALLAAVRHRHESVLAVLLEHGQRAGPAPAEANELRQDCFIQAASIDSMDLFRLLVDHIALDAAQLTELLLRLLDRREICEPAVGLLLDRYVGTLLSVVDVVLLERDLPRGPAADTLSTFLARKAGMDVGPGAPG